MTVAVKSDGAALRCPHCGAALPAASNRSAGRCASCRLVIGAGRTVGAEQAAAIHAGTRAGIIANRSQRKSSEPVSAEQAICAVTEVAAVSGGGLEKLTMGA